MNAEILLLTHFSARYPKMPPSFQENEAGSEGKKAHVGLAFDNTVLRMGDMWKLQHYQSALATNFAYTMEEDDVEDDVSGVMEVNIG